MCCFVPTLTGNVSFDVNNNLIGGLWSTLNIAPVAWLGSTDFTAPFCIIFFAMKCLGISHVLPNFVICWHIWKSTNRIIHYLFGWKYLRGGFCNKKSQIRFQKLNRFLSKQVKNKEREQKPKYFNAVRRVNCLCSITICKYLDTFCIIFHEITKILVSRFQHTHISSWISTRLSLKLKDYFVSTLNQLENIVAK